MVRKVAKHNNKLINKDKEKKLCVVITLHDVT